VSGTYCEICGARIEADRFCEECEREIEKRPLVLAREWMRRKGKTP